MSTTPTATTSRRRPRDLRRTWRWGLALLAPLPMLAVAAEAVFVPYGEFATAGEQLTAGAAAPGRLTLALWMGFLGVLLAVPATMAVAWTVRRAAPRLALAGGLSCLVGFGMTWAIPNTDQVVRVAADGGYDVTRVASVIDLVAGHPSANVAVGIFLVGQLIGLVLLGCALWRTPGAPRWAAVALAVSGPLHVAVAGFPVAAAGSWVLTALGYAGASVALVRSRDEDFDLPPAGSSAVGAAATAAGGRSRSRTVAEDPRSVTGVSSATVGKRDVRRAWQWALALSAPVAAAYVAVFRFLLPYSTPDSPHQVFEKLLAAPVFDRLEVWVGLIAAPFSLAGVVAVIWVARRGAPVWTTIAGTLCVLGYSALFSSGSPSAVMVLLATQGRIDPGLEYRLGAPIEALPQAEVAGTLFVIGHLLGTILLGIALWRSRALPAWVGIALAVSQPIHLWSAMTGNHPLDLVGWGLTAVGFGIAGVTALRMSADDFDLPPLPPVPARTAVLRESDAVGAA